MSYLGFLVGLSSALLRAEAPLLGIEFPQGDDYGSVAVPLSKTLYFTLRNLSTVDTLEGLSISIPVGSYAFAGGAYPGTNGTCSLALAPESSCTIYIAFSPEAFEVYESTVSITYHVASELMQSAVDIRGFGGISVQVGGVTDISAVLSYNIGTPARSAVLYSTDPTMRGAVLSTQTTIAPGAALKTQLTNLMPETRYYYAVRVGNTNQFASPYPSFVTYPPPSSTRDFCFAVIADQESILVHPDDPAPAFQGVSALNPAFVLQIGDFDHRNPSNYGAMKRMHRDVRNLTNAAGPDLKNFILGAFPFDYVYDDHDYGINNGDKTFSKRVSAITAYKEDYASYPLPASNNGIWHKFRYAQVEVFMLDLRSERDPNSLPDDASKSMLGAEQKQWLKDGLLGSTARWKILVSTVPMFGKADDGWLAFTTERNELLSFIADNQIGDVFVISGDLHSGGAIDTGGGLLPRLPEISVPHTNVVVQADYSGNTGPWNIGILSGIDGTGFARLCFDRISPDQAHLEVRDASGAMKTLPDGNLFRLSLP